MTVACNSASHVLAGDAENTGPVSLRKPNKRFKLAAEVRRRRILQFLKNIYIVRCFFHVKFGVDMVIWGSDQMPLHENEGTGARTLSFKGTDVSVKEDYSASRKRVTVMTTVSSQAKAPPRPLEFVFKGKGTRVTVRIPYGSGISTQWSPKGSLSLGSVAAFCRFTAHCRSTQQGRNAHLLAG